MGNDLSKLLEAANFAAKKHHGQCRKGAVEQPYIVHPLEVAYLLRDIGKVKDTDVLIAAVLHDTIEDTETTREEIAQRFGERVATIVLEVTDDKSLPKQERKQRQVEHAPHLSESAKQLKMCDKISNISDIVSNPAIGWSYQRKLEYIEWGERVFEGLRGVNSELERHFDDLVRNARQQI